MFHNKVDADYYRFLFVSLYLSGFETNYFYTVKNTVKFFHYCNAIYNENTLQNTNRKD